MVQENRPAADLPRQRLAVGILQVGDDHARALARQSGRAGRPNPARPAGHQRDLALNPFHGV